MMIDELRTPMGAGVTPLMRAAFAGDARTVHVLLNEIEDEI